MTLWSNDGTSLKGSEPVQPISILVANGLFTVFLGDTSVLNMAALPPGVFASASDVRLRV